MDVTAEALKRRTREFATDVLQFVETLPRHAAADAVAQQLARSAIGVAGNYRSACRSRSHAEFTARVGIVLEEADESELWLDVVLARSWGNPEETRRLLEESLQLRSIFSRAFTTARQNESERR